MADLQQEHQREIEGLLENIRQLSRELRLQMLIIDNFIPQDYQVKMQTLSPWCRRMLCSLSPPAIFGPLRNGMSWLPFPLWGNDRQLTDACLPSCGTDEFLDYSSVILWFCDCRFIQSNKWIQSFHLGSFLFWYHPQMPRKSCLNLTHTNRK